MVVTYACGHVDSLAMHVRSFEKEAVRDIPSSAHGDAGLFCGDTGLFCGDIRLLWGDIGLFRSYMWDTASTHSSRTPTRAVWERESV